MRFYNCSDDDTGNSYTGGCNSLIKTIDSSYSSINTSVSAESASGGTPLISALKEAKLYLDDHKAADAAKNCRQKFVILITDGSDTYGCGGDGSECDNDRYKNRREVVAKAKALADAGYKVFVIGFGTAMPPYLRNTLNWMAYYGGTDNPNAANSGSTTAYSIVTGCNATDNPSACCSADEPDCLLSDRRDGCGADGSSLTAACYDATKPYPGTAGNSTADFSRNFQRSRLPGSVGVRLSRRRCGSTGRGRKGGHQHHPRGHLFLFPVVDPVIADRGRELHLRGFLPADHGGSVLARASAAVHHQHRHRPGRRGCRLGCRPRIEGQYDGSQPCHKDLQGRISSGLHDGQHHPGGFGISDPTLTDAQKNAQRDAVVGYIRGESASNPDNWKLGDVFRSTPITVGEPSPYFDDIRDASDPTAFSQHRDDHLRKTSPYSGRLILAGANDGQLHAFRTSDGHEAWSFIPPNMLPRLKLITHDSEPSSLTHQYYVDGPVTVADAWIPGSWSNGRSKSKADWHVLVSPPAEDAGSNPRLDHGEAAAPGSRKVKPQPLRPGP